jgi:hypothetical protein
MKNTHQSGRQHMDANNFKSKTEKPISIGSPKCELHFQRVLGLRCCSSLGPLLCDIEERRQTMSRTIVNKAEK